MIFEVRYLLWDEGSIFSWWGFWVIFPASFSSATSVSTSPSVSTSAYSFVSTSLATTAYSINFRNSRKLDTLDYVPLLSDLYRLWDGNCFLHSIFKLVDILLFWQCIYSARLLKVIKWSGHNIIIFLNFPSTFFSWIYCFRYFLFGALIFDLFVWLCQKNGPLSPSINASHY